MCGHIGFLLPFSSVKILMRETFSTEKTFDNMLMIVTSFCILKLRPVRTNMQGLLAASNNSALPRSSIHHSVQGLEYNVPVELGQLSQRFPLPLLHEVVLTFRDNRAPPPKMTHPIGPIFSFLRDL